MRRLDILTVCLAILAFPLTPSVSGQDAVASPKPSVEDLAKLKQDPLSGLRTVIFQAEVSPNVPGSGKTEGSYSLQPVWPFALTKDSKVITYTILLVPWISPANSTAKTPDQSTTE